MHLSERTTCRAIREICASELERALSVIAAAGVADYTDEMMHAALDINIPNYASAVVGNEEMVASLSAL
jgi:hypothetical protein